MPSCSLLLSQVILSCLAEEEGSVEDDDHGYFLDGSLPSDGKEEVTDDFFL